jgi:predicted enzyme related to lactoylglutathione lyase
MSNRVTHFEIPCNNPKKTMAFFKTVFGWNFQQFGSDEYWFVKTGEDNRSGINGAVSKRRNPQQPITNSINVEDIDKTVGEIKEHGGTVVVEKTAIPQTGWMAFFKDPDENIHGLWQDDKTAK